MIIGQKIRRTEDGRSENGAKRSGRDKLGLRDCEGHVAWLFFSCMMVVVPERERWCL
jgi:hypothetical protein